MRTGEQKVKLFFERRIDQAEMFNLFRVGSQTTLSGNDGIGHFEFTLDDTDNNLAAPSTADKVRFHPCRLFG